jgi:single-stranded-DNA-specific exonuclease
MEIKNLRKAAKRIIKAVKEKENIVIYGDSDMDGISAVVILKETIEKIGGKVLFVYLPEREKEGYGINKKALEFLKKFSPGLFLTVDCGVANFEEIERAKNFGFEVVIIDHHEVLDKIPNASIIVDPKQEEDEYPFKGLCSAGICYKLSEIILKEEHSSFLENFLDITALATIADRMPLEKDNEKLVKKGLGLILNTSRPGIQALIELTGFNNEGVPEVQRKITSVLNSTNYKNHLNEVYFLLTEESFSKAEKIALKLIKNSREKRKDIERIFSEVDQKVKDSDPIIFEGSKDWPLISLGTAASKLVKKYQKPVFLYVIQEEKSQGSVRNPNNLDGVEMMKQCKDLLEVFGGHALASGFRIKNKNLEKFKNCLKKYNL